MQLAQANKDVIENEYEIADFGELLSSTLYSALFVVISRAYQATRVDVLKYLKYE